MAINITNNQIVSTLSKPTLDADYGPYEGSTIEEALAAAESALGFKKSAGKTVGIKVTGSNTVTEYWYQPDENDNTSLVLVEKLASPIEIDDDIDNSSTNPVQNQAIANALAGKADIDDIPTVPSISEGSTNGTINVGGNDVQVHGLGSAAYTASTDYATYAQGGLASSSVQSISKNGNALTKDANNNVDIPNEITSVSATDAGAGGTPTATLNNGNLELGIPRGADGHNPNLGTYLLANISDAPTPTEDGDYIIVVDDSQIPPTAVIYLWDSVNSEWASSGKDANSTEFSTGELVANTGVEKKNASGLSDSNTLLPTSGLVKAEVSQIAQKTPSIINGGHAFSIVDENGNEVARLNGYLKVDANGTVETAGFNSATEKGRTDALEVAVAGIEECPVSSESSDDVLNVADENGNRAVVVNAGVEVQGKVKIHSSGRVKTDSFDSDNVASTINGMQTELARFPRTRFPQINYTKSTFRWLDIGNSHSLCALDYLNYIAKSQGVDLSNVAFCRVGRGGSAFKDWVNGWNDADTDGSGDQLTGGMYDAKKIFGGLSVKVTGNTYTEVNGTPTPVVDQELSQTSTRFWGGDCSILRSLLQDNEWDLITIHQRYIYNEKYDESDGWVNDLESGTDTKSGEIKEFIRILKSTNPQATVGFLFALTPFGFNGTSLVDDEATSLNITLDTHERWCETVKKFMKDSGVDLVIPCDTALQNLRISNVPNVANEWDESETPTILDIYDRWGFNYDPAHTASAGVAPYTMSAVAWEMVFAPRFGVSIMENGLHELDNNDIIFGTKKYLQPSYDDNGVDTIIDDMQGNPWGKPMWNAWSTRSEEGTRATCVVRLTDTNRLACQMAAMLAVSDMWEVNNPDSLTI